MTASFACAACSSSSNAPPRAGAADGAALDAAGTDAAGGAGDGAAGGAPDADGPPAACADPLTQASTLLAGGFDAWEGLGVLGCLDPSDPDAGATLCEDADVTGGAFTVTTSVCTGSSWDVHIFDGSRGLDCVTTRPPTNHVFTLTPGDCACASPNRDPANGCAGDADGGSDGGSSNDRDAD
ncbi:MAG TPA: hypothetical protein VHL80_12690 [Polyangia bacterium]|nr:hypothetical protein [Polyangia bacterium]